MLPNFAEFLTHYMKLRPHLVLRRYVANFHEKQNNNNEFYTYLVLREGDGNFALEVRWYSYRLPFFDGCKPFAKTMLDPIFRVFGGPQLLALFLELLATSS